MKISLGCSPPRRGFPPPPPCAEGPALSFALQEVGDRIERLRDTCRNLYKALDLDNPSFPCCSCIIPASLLHLPHSHVSSLPSGTWLTHPGRQFSYQKEKKKKNPKRKKCFHVICHLHNEVRTPCLFHCFLTRAGCAPGNAATSSASSKTFAAIPGSSWDLGEDKQPRSLQHLSQGKSNLLQPGPCPLADFQRLREARWAQLGHFQQPCVQQPD